MMAVDERWEEDGETTGERLVMDRCQADQAEALENRTPQSWHREGHLVFCGQWVAGTILSVTFSATHL